jgi:hypothetical protein
VVITVSPTGAVTIPNACKNSVTANNAQTSVSMIADAPASVSASGSVTLSNIQQTASVPGSIFVAGYNLGLLAPGPNTIPATVVTKIEGTNTVEGTQDTNPASTSISTTITDPDGSPGTGDESATDGSFTVTYADQTWTAGSSGTIDFREDTVPIGSGSGVLHTGGLKITETIGGFLSVRFGCSPGTVAGPDPGVVTLADPAVSFASTGISAGNQAPTADAGADQTVASGANVDLDGTGSSDPDQDALDYSWTQTSGSAVTLSGADTATPSFTAPDSLVPLTFQLEVCDGEPLCDTDSVVITVSPTGAVTIPNACKNSVTANNAQTSVSMIADAPASVSAGGSVTLSNIQQTASVPGSIFVAGYNLGLLAPGPNTIPATVVTKIEGTNTVEGTQDTNTASTSISTTITDPDGSPGTGDETATDGSFTVTYADQTWTAGASGTIEFREDTVQPVSGAGGGVGGIKINTVIGGALPVNYGCSPGTVTGPDPGVITYDDPAASLASSDIVSPNQAPTADAGSDQTVASGANVNLDGTGSTDPDGDPLDYGWTQTGGAAVTLSGANTATPSFTAPTGPATLTFQLEVCDGEPLCDTATVVITVQEPIPVFLGFLQPLPYEKLRSTSSISVKFQLGDDAGTLLSDEEALLRQTQVVLSANPNGSNPLALVTCLYSASKNRYQCSLKPPKNVVKYPTPYYITVLEQVGGSNVVAPTGPTSATDNPLIIFFK